MTLIKARFLRRINRLKEIFFRKRLLDSETLTARRYTVYISWLILIHKLKKHANTKKGLPCKVRFILYFISHRRV